MRPRRAQERFGLERLSFYSQMVPRQVLVHTPSERAAGEPIYLWLFDSTSVLLSAVGMIYPNGLLGVGDELGLSCACLLPMRYGFLHLLHGYRMGGSPFHKPGEPDDTLALDGAMDRVELDHGRGRHGLIGFSNGGTAAFAAACSNVLRDRVDFVVAVNSTIWGPCEGFDKLRPPAGQSALFINGGADKRIPWNGTLDQSRLGRLERRLMVRRMPDSHSPQLLLPLYGEANGVSVQHGDFQINTDAHGVVTTTYQGVVNDSRNVILEGVLDPDLPHMWPGREEDGADTESLLSKGNRRDAHGKRRRPHVDANQLIIAFLRRLYPRRWAAAV